MDAYLVETLLDLVRIDSYIGQEQALCDYVQQRLSKTLGAAAIQRFEHSLVVRANSRPGAPRIALVGHLDVVRTSHDAPPRVEGDRLYGPGAADMKAGLALMIAAVEHLELATLPCELTLVFYEREEGPFDENMLGPMLDHFAELRRQDLAICLEPSNNELQLGCMGSLHATVRFLGRTAHSARPWQGENAILKSWPFLQALAARGPETAELDGHQFREVISPTIAQSLGRGRNVIPDRFELNINYRFAPVRTADEALQRLQALVGDAAEVEAVDKAPAGRPHATHPLVQHLAQSGVATVTTKQAWTDVARFDALDVPAVNFGPGSQAQAHQRNEFTEISLLAPGYAALVQFLTTLPALPSGHG